MSTIDRMLRREEVQERTGLSRSAIYRLMREGDFPLPQRVGQHDLLKGPGAFVRRLEEACALAAGNVPCRGGGRATGSC